MSARDAERAALALVWRATRSREDAEERWKEALRDAVAAGHSLGEIAEHAGVSRERISQIVGPVGVLRKETKR